MSDPTLSGLNHLSFYLHLFLQLNSIHNADLCGVALFFSVRICRFSDFNLLIANKPIPIKFFTVKHL